MSGFILGKKAEQFQMFDENGVRIPVTLLKTAPCHIIGMRIPEQNRYFSVQLGFGVGKNIKKTVKGTLEKAGIKTPLRFLREFRLEKSPSVQSIEENGKIGIMVGETKFFSGDEIKPILLFKKGDKVTVSGTSKGKGFQGVVKRHRFAGGPRTHGQSDRERAPGSIGQGTTPGRVYKGKRMAGRMGGDRITIKGLEVIDVKEDGLLLKGLIPGAKGGLIEVKSEAVKVKS